MAALLFALLSLTLAGLGARDQTLLAVMAVRHNRRPALLVVAFISAIAACLLAAGAAQAISTVMPGPARLLFAAMALALAGVEMIAARKVFAPLEPTHSLGAFALVLFVRQITDSSRFVLVGIAAATRAAIPTAMGGCAAALALTLAGWLAAEELAERDLARLRRVIGALLLLVAIGLALVTLRQM